MENHNFAKVKLKRKIIIEPQNQNYVLVSANVTDTESCDILFTPNFSNDDVQVFPSVHSFVKGHKTCQFYVLIKNESHQTVHINKNTVIGSVSPVCLPSDPVPLPTSNCIDSSTENLPINFCNLIQATPDVLNKRQAEFNPSNFNLKHLSAYEQDSMYRILNNFAAFSSSLQTLGHTDLIVPKLKFSHDYPVKTLPFPIPHALQAEAKQQLDELQAAGIIERNSSEWACPMLLVKKKPDPNGKISYRLALDLRLINELIQNSTYPLPKIQDIISNMAQYKFFTTIDLKNAYHQIDLPENVQDRLTVTTLWGSFKYKRLVFGLKTAASTFQALIDTVIQETNLPGIFAYQDDIVLCSMSFSESCSKLKTLLELFAKYNLTACPSKCNFHTDNINYLGFHISQGKISPISANIQKITGFQVPNTKRQLKRFIGLCSYYRNLIPQFAQLLHPLVRMTSPSVPFKWDSDANHAFLELQSIFFTSPFIQQPMWDHTFYLNTDASKNAISAVLLQFINDQYHPVSYFSKTLNAAESNYPAIKLELMAIVKAVESFKHYLYSRHFVILSDSKPLKHYRKVTSPANIITRWLLQLSEYSFTFQHIAGAHNVLPDFFSRQTEVVETTLVDSPELLDSCEVLPVVTTNENINHVSNVNGNTICNEDMCYDESNVCNSMSHCHAADFSNTFSDLSHDHLTHTHRSSNGVNVSTCKTNIYEHVLYLSNVNTKLTLHEIQSHELLKEQLRDPSTNHFYNKVLNSSNDDCLDFAIEPKSMLLMTKGHSHNGKTASTKPRIILPASLVDKAIAIAHITHFGIAKTFSLVARKYYFKGLFNRVKRFIQACHTCNKVKKITIPKAPLQAREIPRRVLDLVSIDILGPFDNTFVLNVVDIFSRHLQLYPLHNTSANTIVQKLFHYCTTFGRPKQILSDNGPQFISTILHAFLKKFNISLSHSSAYHPEANAVSERVNRSIKSTVAALQLQKVSLSHALALHASIYNASVHPATRASPNLIFFGRALPLITDTFNVGEELPCMDTAQLLCQINDATEKLIKTTYQNLMEAQRKQNLTVNASRKMRTFAVGDTAYVRTSSKFLRGYSGPFVVKRVISPVVVVIQQMENPSAPLLKRHINLLLWAPPRGSKDQCTAFNANSNFRSTLTPPAAACDLPADLRLHAVDSPPTDGNPVDDCGDDVVLASPPWRPTAICLSPVPRTPMGTTRSSPHLTSVGAPGDLDTSLVSPAAAIASALHAPDQPTSLVPPGTSCDDSLPRSVSPRLRDVQMNEQSKTSKHPYYLRPRTR